MTEKQISSISEFLLHAGTDYRVFDMGRTIRSIPAQTFLEIENGQIEAPFPRLQHGWFGLVFWDKTRSSQHFIWFIKLPLDEQGKVISATRNHFLQIIVDALGAQLENAEAKNGQLPENPYTFVPNQQQLADFNSISRKRLGLGHSEHFTNAKAYLHSPLVLDWQQVPLQGLADFVAHLDDQPDHQSMLMGNWPNYPLTVQLSLLTSMENQPLEETLVAHICQWLTTSADDPQKWQTGLRALGQSTSHQQVIELLYQCLNSQLAQNWEVLSVISGRLSYLLEDNQLLRLFFQNVALTDPQYGLFKGIFSDLVQQPTLRHHCLNMLRWTDKSPELTQAVGSLFSQINTTPEGQ